MTNREKSPQKSPKSGADHEIFWLGFVPQWDAVNSEQLNWNLSDFSLQHVLLIRLEIARGLF
jgi:hypothetical protein